MKLLFSKISILAFGAAALLMAATSCGTSRRVSSSASGHSTYKPTPPPRHIDLSVPHLPTVNTLLREADTWIGTAYAFGGNDRQGVDCSGFVTQVFSRALDIRLPRTSWQQFEYCTPLTRDQLQEGDLVFFTVHGGSTIGHVGIYIGNGSMIHASSSKGVIISSLSQPYYVTNYYGAGRIESFYALVEKERSGRNPLPDVPVITAPEILTAEEPSVAVPAYAEAPKSTQSGGGTLAVTPVRIARGSKTAAPPAASVSAPVGVQTAPAAVSSESEPESGLAELSEFFD